MNDSLINDLRTAHDKLMQAQQKVDGRDLDEQRLLEDALDAINRATMSVQNGQNGLQ